MNKEEKEQLKLLIEEYEESYKQSKYEGNIEEYEYLKETHKLLKDTLNYIDKLQKELDNSISKDKIKNKMQEYLFKAVKIESIRVARQTTKEEDEEIMLCRTVAGILSELLGDSNE